MRALPSLLFCIAILAAGSALASGGPPGVNHRIHHDKRCEANAS